MIRQIRYLLKELDWDTPVNRVKNRDHWRVSLVSLVGTLSAFAVWHALFPDTLWFFKLWGALCTGGLFGNLIGYAWQLTDASRRARSSGRLFMCSAIGGVGGLFPVAILLVGPFLHSQEMELARIRTLSVSDVSSISAQTAEQPPVRVVDQAAITSFVKKCRTSNLFYPSHESFTNKSRLAVQLVDGTIWTYEAGIPMRHQADLVLTFRSYVGYSHVLIPNGAKWLAFCENPGESREENQQETEQETEQDTGTGPVLDIP